MPGPTPRGREPLQRAGTQYPKLGYEAMSALDLVRYSPRRQQPAQEHSGITTVQPQELEQLNDVDPAFASFRLGHVGLRSAQAGSDLNLGETCGLSCTAQAP